MRRLVDYPMLACSQCMHLGVKLPLKSRYRQGRNRVHANDSVTDIEPYPDLRDWKDTLVEGQAIKLAYSTSFESGRKHLHGEFDDYNCRVVEFDIDV